MRRCGKEYSASPLTDELRTGRRSSFRVTVRRPSSTEPTSSPLMKATAPAQKTVPTTAASCRRAFRSAGSVSSRAAITPWTVSGIGMSAPPRAPRRGVSRDRDVGAGRHLHGRAPALDDPAVREHASELPRVQRVAAGTLEQGELRRAGQFGSAPVSRDQAARLVARERGERDRGGVALAPAPAGPALEELGPRGADDQER